MGAIVTPESRPKPFSFVYTNRKINFHTKKCPIETTPGKCPSVNEILDLRLDLTVFLAEKRLFEAFMSSPRQQLEHTHELLLAVRTALRREGGGGAPNFRRGRTGTRAMFTNRAGTDNARRRILNRSLLRPVKKKDDLFYILPENPAKFYFRHWFVADRSSRFFIVEFLRSGWSGVPPLHYKLPEPAVMIEEDDVETTDTSSGCPAESGKLQESDPCKGAITRGSVGVVSPKRRRPDMSQQTSPP
ncbi:hypothetical protein EVAR_36131_1 [Eumeta japonica]|uniref:Uncharacterized protein n=1 Tax=Eumeta variegata TaxID=151549 RepID=A0A4C1X525_EUMVA|nr:hypothetical protein EVAR_36131_1 [Eumeta japonica]